MTEPEHYSGPDDGDDISSKWWFKGRIMDKNMAHEKFLSDPCDESVASDRELTAKLVSMHSTVFSEGKPDCSVGDIVLAFIDPGDNNNLYDLQNLKFIKLETKINKALEIGNECYTLSTLFEQQDGDTSNVGSALTPPQAANRSSKFNKNLETYKKLSAALRDNVLKHIREHESRNDPNIRNFGVAGRGTTSSPILTTLTFEQVRAVHRGKEIDGVSYKNTEGKKPFALGLYQIIPDTLDYVVGVLPDLKDKLFSEENQHIAGTVLIFDKRPKMGSYLLGEHNNVVAAGQHWAYEWAYAPSHYSINAGAHGDGTYPKVDIQPGMSYYSGTGGNKVGTSTEEIIKVLKEGRKAVAGILSDIQEVNEENSPTPGQPPPSGFNQEELDSAAQEYFGTG